ncbi:hypothetical protein PGT21_024658 [Puccinia graminis f. sp. tritici]|uniref:Uncharacterized protein n=1 Tax=Puccinia graminis f. sp. tritici TaxID=56615 RepID=A0A5B0MID7_PUCGR|nr:hypothetical protein PGT21_024658 [Puccinia graminis f. sp. tritici]KAA1078912.1 hypothetical protein PGTUg99_020576 [Puccinia graminis f. sp. tritici]
MYDVKKTSSSKNKAVEKKKNEKIAVARDQGSLKHMDETEWVVKARSARSV